MGLLSVIAMRRCHTTPTIIRSIAKYIASLSCRKHARNNANPLLLLVLVLASVHDSLPAKRELEPVPVTRVLGGSLNGTWPEVGVSGPCGEGDL